MHSAIWYIPGENTIKNTAKKEAGYALCTAHAPVSSKGSSCTVYTLYRHICIVCVALNAHTHKLYHITLKKAFIEPTVASFWQMGRANQQRTACVTVAK